ncbi:MAG: GFA family protein [Burkholderiales bacterium]
MTLHASCLCKGIALEIDGSIRDLLYCHCSMCRKSHGSAFRARGRVRTTDLRWVRGEELMRFYESSPGELRGFCSVCGSNIFTKFANRPRELGLALGILDDDPGTRPICHVFVGSKAPWHEITDDLPQYEAFPSGYAAPKTEAGGN